MILQKSIFISVILFLATTGINFVQAENSSTTVSEKLLTVQTKYGELEGKMSKSRNSNVFYEFLGIPYGKVKLRFQSAVEADKWEGVRKATEFGSQCLQLTFGTNKVVGRDDCLFLNVYSAKLNPTEKFPVMVFIHGGGYFMGSGSQYGAKYIIDHGVILVTINYRLGPFGFLNGGIEEAEGNVGSKDQVLALKWIKENIEGFGGDPSRVTIFGESAGASAVSLLTLSPLAEGLFHNAIAQSGSALTPGVFENNPLANAKKLAHSVDCPTSNLKYMVECLRKIEPEYILANVKLEFMGVEETANDWSQTSQFMPSVETYPDDSLIKKFLPLHPYKILKDGKFNAVPFIIGNNEAELLLSAGSVVQNKKLIRRFNEEWESFVPYALGYADKTKDTCVIASKIKEFYLNNEKVSNGSLEGLEKMFSDRWFLHSSKLVASLYSKYAPTYLYNFTFRGKSSFSEMFKVPGEDPNAHRPVHYDEIQYQFSDSGFFPTPNIGLESPFYSFSERFLQLWTSFAKTGKPTDLWGIEDSQQWPTLNLSGSGTYSIAQWLQIDNNTVVVEEHPSITNRIEFWENLPLLENGKIFPDKTEKSEL